MKTKNSEGFYQRLFVLVLPIVIQNLITSSVNLADVIMLGQVDQTSLSASSLAGQVYFLLDVVYFGLTSALTILASQYWGKGDAKTLSRILGIGLIIIPRFLSYQNAKFHVEFRYPPVSDNHTYALS